MKISIAGAGMFGFALAYHIEKKIKKMGNHTIESYDRDEKLIEHLKKHKTHLYHFKDKKLSSNTTFSTNIKKVVKNADILIMAVPSQAIREITIDIRENLKNGIIIVNTAKALEIKTAKIPSQIIQEELKDANIKYDMAKLSGGTFAKDIMNNAPLGADIACQNKDSLKKLQEILHGENLRVYANNDLKGVEYAGAFKNIIAIFAGIINGLGLPYGSETHMISRAAKEAKEVAISLGAKKNTFSMESQCWGNDLWMTCTGSSRNRDFGIFIGKGMNPNSALAKMESQHKLVEGYYTVAAIPQLSKKTGVKTPIMNEIYEIVYKTKNVKQSINELMRREPENIT